MATETRDSQHAIEVVDSGINIPVRESQQAEEALRADPNACLHLSQQAEEAIRGIFSEMIESQHVLEVTGLDLFALANVKLSHMALEVIMSPAPAAPSDVSVNTFVST